MSINNIIANTKQSYLPHTDKLPKIAVDYIWNDLLVNEGGDVKRLLFIIRKSQEININKYGGMTPIPYELIKKKGYVEALEKLKDLNIVQYTGFSKAAKRCRSYWINWDLYKKIDNLIPGRVENFSNNNWKPWNGINNKEIRESATSRHKIYKYNKRKKKYELTVSEVVENGILPIKFCIIDFINVETYLNYQRELYMKKVLTASEGMKYLNNERCYRNILMNGFIIDSEHKNLLLYEPRYRGQKTGRRSEIGGGFQSCSREMKHEAFYFLPNIRNYDLKSSQMYGLKYAFMSARFDTSIVDKYLAIDKAVWASQIGIDKDTWKGLMYGAYFGGFPSSYFRKDGTMIDKKTYIMLKCEIVRKHICKFLGIETWYNYKLNRHECNDTVENNKAIQRILSAFYVQNKDLIDKLKEWRDYLATDFFNSNFEIKGGKKYIWNRSNMPIEMTQYMNSKGVISNKGKRDLASHILQGQEALFISCITSYSLEEDCPYEVMSDQADGVIVQGFIPDEYQERARQDSKFEFAYLEEKPYL